MRIVSTFYIQGVQLQTHSEVIVNKVANKEHLGDISLRIAVFSKGHIHSQSICFICVYGINIVFIV